MKALGETTNLKQINDKMLQYIEQGVISSEPLDLLLSGGKVLAKEGVLWDYKAELNLDKEALAKTVLQVVAFHNTYGGYLVYGIQETQRDLKFQAVSVDFSSFDLAQLRNLISRYTGCDIDLTFSVIEKDLDGNTYSMGLLHIPKRIVDSKPVSFIRNGPNKNNKPIFNSGDTYLRTLDEKRPAKLPSDWELLFSPRISMYVEHVTARNIAKALDHNLPDRHLICSELIGREETLTQLWEWLSDDFEYTKILCGDGGKGKTSIAYEFSTRFVSSAPFGYERVVWLSVKERQFSGIDDNYFNLQDSDFTCSKSFLLTLSEKCSLEPDDYDGVATSVIKKELRDVLPIFPSLVVVDDIDSLNDDEQRKVVDYCRQLGSDKVRFLVTTRKKLAYSSELCIDIPGLPREDYSKYVELVSNRLKLQSYKKSLVDKLFKATDGSPLLTASILRLCKLGLNLDVAINDWKGHAGEDARNAAIRREIESLSKEAKRALLCIFYFSSCSSTELKQAAGFQNTQLLESVEELQALFLVGEPSIIEGEARYKLSTTTALVVQAIERELALDFNKLKSSVKEMKLGTSNTGKQGNRRLVGLVIRQSVALLNDGKYENALETVEEGLKSYPKNPDLLLTKVRCLSEVDKPNYSLIKNLASQSIKNGQKRERIFEYLYVAEVETNSTQGVVECCCAALSTLDSNHSVWHRRLADGYLNRARLRGFSSSFKDLTDASDSLTIALKNLKGDAKSVALKDLSAVHDRIWKVLERNTDFSWLDSFDEVLKLIKKGDVRTRLFKNARLCLSEAEAEFKTRGRDLPNAYLKRARVFNHTINSRSKQDKKDRPFGDLLIGLSSKVDLTA
ncbi:TPA: ATP-binding protein [Vibrio alginolyticus]|nr:ATP-binding protein [Vibrio alginolyticus]HBK6031145.1 ATP-binding protein [Vibrio alginolyticus]